MTEAFWTLSGHSAFEAPGLSALVFHNRYPEGKQGGFEVIQHDERILSCGDLRVSTMPGQWNALPEVGDLEIAEDGAAKVSGRFAAPDLAYALRVCPQGAGLRVCVDMAAPLPEALAGVVGFNLEIYPPAYIGKTFMLAGTQQMDGVHCRFPQQANGPCFAEASGDLRPVPLACGAHLIAAPEDPLRRFEIASETGTMILYDGRQAAQNGWFVLRELVQPGATTEAVVWMVTPNSVPGWRRTPVIALSQVGYHPDQVKRAILELDSRTELLADVALERIDADGPVEVVSAHPERWGDFLRYTYAVFDFTHVREPGRYRVHYGEQVTSVFGIHRQIYQHDVWQPTLETFFPVQMCHVAVKDRYRTWHGACHLDDALQAPSQHQHFDGYRQHAAAETSYGPLEHIPHLDRGGWHDAGDYDLAAGSQARTTHVLALARELFGLDTDQTTVDQARRLVLLHTPDGVPDILEQVAHGVENLLGGYRAAGHSFHGTIANSLDQYVHLGDAATMTDNRVDTRPVTPEEIAGNRAHQAERQAGLKDDRWAFTNRDTALEYLVAGTLAAAGRVLRDAMPELAAECLATAVQVWDCEHSHTPIVQRGGYVPRRVEDQEVLAAVELLLATGEDRYRERLLMLWPAIETNVLRVGPHVARALPALADTVFEQKLRDAVAGALPAFEAALQTNPFGIVFRPHIWGIGWQLLGHAVGLYQLRTAFPDLIDREIILRVLNYNLGCHPASSTSLVSGVGACSATVAYGVNRADWSYTPGGVISGPALIRPDFPELKEPWPYLWQQTEYVISGAANYIFCVVAADRMLNTV